MKFKLLIWLIALYLFILPSMAIDENDMTDEICMDNFNRPDNNTIGTSDDIGCVASTNSWTENEAVAGVYSIDANRLQYDATSDVIGNNVSIETYLVNRSVCRIREIGDLNVGIYFDIIRFYDSEGQYCYKLRYDESPQQTLDDDDGTMHNFATGSIPTLLNLSVIFDFPNSVNVTLMNNTNYTRNLINNCNNISKFEVYTATNAAGGTNELNNITCINGTSAGAEPDTTPPEINQNSYNMTSEGGEGCTNWRTDKTNPCSTGDTTPTVEFTTDENAFCAIGVSDLNYTGMVSSRNCTIGEGTTSHACTLILQDELVYEDSTVYLSCKDTSNNENTTSNSGPLSLTITGLEAGGSAAIGVGVQNALLSGYTNYTNQQIYARNLDGTQDTGTFDWVAKKGSKVWAFNFITKEEVHVGMFNLTPVLYVLEMANITNSTIINTVEAMINATK